MCAASWARKRQKPHRLQAQHWQAGPPWEPGQPAATLPEGNWLDWLLWINQANCCVCVSMSGLITPHIFHFILIFVCSWKVIFEVANIVFWRILPPYPVIVIWSIYIYIYIQGLMPPCGHGRALKQAMLKALWSWKMWQSFANSWTQQKHDQWQS